MPVCETQYVALHGLAPSRLQDLGRRTRFKQLVVRGTRPTGVATMESHGRVVQGHAARSLESFKDSSQTARTRRIRRPLTSDRRKQAGSPNISGAVTGACLLIPPHGVARTLPKKKPPPKGVAEAVDAGVSSMGTLAWVPPYAPSCFPWAAGSLGTYRHPDPQKAILNCSY